MSTLPTTMQRVSIYKYGPPQNLVVEQVPVPVPGPQEVLVRVMAASVNRTDCGFLTGKPYIARLFGGIPNPRYRALGCEFAGLVAAVGNKVTKFKPGQRVFGFNDARFGAHAQFVLQKETAAMALIPNTVSYQQAATGTEGVHYAWNNLQKAGVRPGMQVLINGATGAIGSAAVQLAKYLGATVTAVCAAKHAPLVASLGASRVIDYTSQDFTKLPERFHFVFDAVGKSSFTHCKKLLLPRGIYISTELGPAWQNVRLGLLAPFMRGPKALFPIPFHSAEKVAFLGQLMAQGHFNPVIDRTYPLHQVPQAFEYVASGQKIGNVLVEIPPVG
ncbi:MAG TPA: NAD(P)-dependent alcohol dehydrogenase [Phnomibacter sp.]|nr:NAD(P)-dependent alcohol dehydrogenase [Phnomibacter sp.]